MASSMRGELKGGELPGAAAEDAGDGNFDDHAAVVGPWSLVALGVAVFSFGDRLGVASDPSMAFEAEPSRTGDLADDGSAGRPPITANAVVVTWRRK